VKKRRDFSLDYGGREIAHDGEKHRLQGISLSSLEGFSSREGKPEKEAGFFCYFFSSYPMKKKLLSAGNAGLGGEERLLTFGGKISLL